MTKRIAAIITPVLLCALFSCQYFHPNDESCKRTEDSLKSIIQRCEADAARIARMQKQFQDSVANMVGKSVATQYKVKGLKGEIGKTWQRIQDEKSSLAAEKDRLARMRQFQYGRTAEERDQQIKKQNDLIKSME